MAQIRIYLDGTFEATAGKYSFATDKERRDRIKVLQGDLKIMDKVEKLRVEREHNKKAIAGLKGPQKEKARAKDKEFLGKIKDLKAKLTSPRHNSSKLIGQMIRQTMDTVVGGKTIGQIAKEAGIKPGSKSSPKEQLAARQRKAVHAPKKPTYAPSTVTKNRKAVESKQFDTLGLDNLSAKEKTTAKKYLKMNTHDILRATEGGKPAESRLAGRIIAGQLGPEDRDAVRAAFSKHQNRVTRNILRTKPDGGKADSAAAAELMRALNKGDKLHGIIGDPRKAFELAAGIVEGDDHMRAAAKK